MPFFAEIVQKILGLDYLLFPDIKSIKKDICNKIIDREGQSIHGIDIVVDTIIDFVMEEKPDIIFTEDIMDNILNGECGLTLPQAYFTREQIAEREKMQRNLNNLDIEDKPNNLSNAS